MGEKWQENKLRKRWKINTGETEASHMDSQLFIWHLNMQTLGGDTVSHSFGLLVLNMAHDAYDKQIEGLMNVYLSYTNTHVGQ